MFPSKVCANLSSGKSCKLQTDSPQRFKTSTFFSAPTPPVTRIEGDGLGGDGTGGDEPGGDDPGGDKSSFVKAENIVILGEVRKSIY